MRNSLHSSKPRWSRKVMEQMGVDVNDVQEAYNDLLIKEGLGVGDYGFTGTPNYDLLQASDEYMVNPLRTHDTPYNIKGKSPARAGGFVDPLACSSSSGPCALGSR